MNVVTRGMRNAFRNITRTVSIVVILGLSIGLSLVMLIAHQAVRNKVNATLSSIGTTINIEPAGFIPGSSVNNVLTSSELKKVKTLAHITSLTETLSGELTTIGTSSLSGNTSQGNYTSLKPTITLDTGHIQLNPGQKLPPNFSPPINVWATTDPTHLTDGSDVTLKSGKQINGNKDTSNALISTAMASKNGLKVGSTFTAWGKTLVVAGIFNGNSTSLTGDTVITSLATWQRLSGSGDEVTGATATVDSLTNLSAATTAIKHQLGSSADVTSNLTQANNALQPLKSIENVALFSLIGAVIAGAVIILLTMIMIVRERKREIGVFKAIGFSNIRIMLQFMGESLTFTLLGAVIGLVFGLVGANPVTSALVNSSGGNNGPGSGKPMSISSSSATLQNLTNVHTEVGFSIILYGLGAAILIALIGSALASYFISKVRPAEVLRSE